ncbi:hypothetical protein BD324DRAFT_630410 [Kockovaella imperatae]|uniref:Uncharacterized protein n=1 Tax=Kockovaella imperatae TaxID=4999 RepID=A0A1Y1UDM0_9TREE|nr:hypothetical protein BD324DRAFT_630410 [Kockovaella imperatae]ORX36158.1 hypothetical protein BD324DRAFT_630410 [Kockovaella imperatae]
MDEDALLRRFNALRAPSHVLLDIEGTGGERSAGEHDAETIAAAAAAAEREDRWLEDIADGKPAIAQKRGGDLPSSLLSGSEDDHRELERRVRALTGRRRQSSDHMSDHADEEVEAYLANLASTDPPEGDFSDPLADRGSSSATKSVLARDARRALDAASAVLPRDGQAGEEEVANDDGETEEEILARALAEAALEKDQLPSDDPHETISNTSFAFPSLPSHIPVDEDPEPGPEVNIDDDTRKRMDLLLGLSGPAQKPGQASLPAVPKRAPGQGWNLPGYNDARDDDLESWCCICNKDAELVCLGCDSDLYCAACWTDGHAFEKHRTKKFTWNRKAMGV